MADAGAAAAAAGGAGRVSVAGAGIASVDGGVVLRAGGAGHEDAAAGGALLLSSAILAGSCSAACAPRAGVSPCATPLDTSSGATLFATPVAHADALGTGGRGSLPAAATAATAARGTPSAAAGTAAVSAVDDTAGGFVCIGAGGAGTAPVASPCAVAISGTGGALVKGGAACAVSRPGPLGLGALLGCVPPLFGVEAPLLSAGLLLATAVAAVAANDMAAGVKSGAATQLSSLLCRAFDPAAAGALVLAAAAASGSRVL